VNTVQGLATGAVNTVETVSNGAVSAVGAVGQGAISLAEAEAKLAVGALKTTWSGIQSAWNTASSAAGQALHWLGEKAGQLGTWLQQSVLHPVTQWATQQWNALSGWVAEQFPGLVACWKAFESFAASAWDKIKQVPILGTVAEATGGIIEGAVLGAAIDHPTVWNMIGQIGVTFIPGVGEAAMARDAAVTLWKFGEGTASGTDVLLNLAGLVPGLGALKAEKGMLKGLEEAGEASAVLKSFGEGMEHVSPEFLQSLSKNGELLEALGRNPEALEALAKNPEAMAALAKNPELASQALRYGDEGVSALAREGEQGLSSLARDADEAASVTKAADEASSTVKAADEATDVTKITEEGGLANQNERGLPETNPREQKILEDTTSKRGSELNTSEFEAETSIVDRTEPRNINEGPYKKEVELENGHEWKEREDGVWCRFSSSGDCFDVDDEGNIIKDQVSDVNSIKSTEPIEEISSQEELKDIASVINQSPDEIVRILREGDVTARNEIRNQVFSKLRNMVGGETPLFEGHILDTVLEENINAIKAMRDRLVKLNPDAIIGVERGGGFLGEVLTEGHPELEALFARISKGENNAERLQNIRQFITQMSSDEGKKTFALVDYYMGGSFADKLRDLYKSISKEIPDINLNNFWMRETIGFEEREQIGQIILRPQRGLVGEASPYANNISNEFSNVRMALGDDMDIVFDQTSQVPIKIFNKEGEILRTIPVGTPDPITGQPMNVRQIMIRLLQGKL